MVVSIILSVIIFIGFMILCFKKLNDVNEFMWLHYLLISIILVPVMIKISMFWGYLGSIEWYDGPIFQIFAILIALTSLYKENVTQIYGAIISIFLTCIGFYIFRGEAPLQYLVALGGVAIGHICTLIINIVFKKIHYDLNRLTYRDFANKYL